MRASLRLLASLVILFGSASQSQGEDTIASSPKLKIGVIAPLTGGVATWGRSVLTAIEVANSDSPHPAEINFEDEETCSPTKALSAYNFLRTVKKVDIIVASCLEGGQAIAPLAAREKVPFFVSGRSSHDFQSKNPNALSWLSLLDYEGEAIATLITEQKWKSGAAMVWNGYFGVQFAESIRNAITKKNLPFTYSIVKQDPSSTPTGAEIQQLIKDTPDVVFLMMAEPTAGYVVKQLQALNYQGKIVLQSSMLQTYDAGARFMFKGSFQQKFIVDPFRFLELQKKIRAKTQQEVADDFIFSYDGYTALLNEATECKKQGASSLDACITARMRDEKWRTGVSGKFRFMKDGSTERPMVFKTITEIGFK